MTSRVFTLTAALLLSIVQLRATSELPGVGRSFGHVRDAASAIRIAVAVWEPIYGKQNIASERPFQAKLHDGIWHVRGSLRRGWVGGVAEADIRQSDGKVLHITHGK
jgi:hypothetical protein